MMNRYYIKYEYSYSAYGLGSNARGAVRGFYDLQTDAK